ncbi:hypothetical protein M436DRAFT_70787 [Aureobasidium namibiae CBS 147.97]|uniref:Uncharacterized protein n=1 Tax=Aureobasidium namibiae CBS 147.97 TaxID=1043004 RepID=A0A074WQ54_9PEZI|nr:uncharacterized protein M436DRAFT_70787 [Aureobasidium namibiae CBS 147.97]KEQ75268.1 hypothetical protein M436DRAFT_70787 [Aureobasidium namibiae CBS 147.97]
MPPKRAAKTAARVAPADKKTPPTRATRSRVQKMTPPREEQPEVSSVTRSTRSRKSTTTEQDAPAQDEPAQDEEEEEQVATRDAKPQPRRRPPRTVKKPAPTQANTEVMAKLKERMEEERRATKAGHVLQSATETKSQQAERDAALVPAGPAPRSPSPARQTAVPGTAVKAPGNVMRPQSAVKMQSTPGAESSVLALQNFRRRARQPSLLQMVQNPGLAATNIDDTTDFTLGSLGDEDDFAPHDEGTPLQVSKGQPMDVDQEPEENEAEDEVMAEQEKARTPEPALPDSDEDLYGATPVKTSQRQSRKRKSDAIEESEIQINRSSPSLPSPSQSLPDPQDRDAIPATAPEDDDEEPTISASQQRRLFSDTYADPMSSSPPPDPISSSPAQTRQAPALSPSAIRRSARAGGQQTKKVKPLTTATLRAMLPKRRNQRKDEFDFTSSSAQEASSSAFEDEKRKKAKTKRLAATKKPAPAPLKSKKPAATAKRTSRTYTRNDKENDFVHISSGSSSLSELNSDEVEADETADTSIETIKGNNSTEKISDELKRAREKFAEVDDWEMEFESASLGQQESSPWR